MSGGAELVNRSAPRSAQAKRDRRHQAAVVGLLAMRGAPVAEEARLVGVGVEAEVLEAGDSGPRGALGDIGVEIEHRPPGVDASGEETVRTLVVGFESGDEFRADLVRRLGDAGAERRADPIDPRPERGHRGDRRFDDAAERALPAGVRGADHARLRVGEQDHAAIGAGDAEAEAGRRGDQRVATRPRFARERRRDRQRVGRMDLIGDRQTLGRNLERRRHARAVRDDRAPARRASRRRR